MEIFKNNSDPFHREQPRVLIPKSEYTYLLRAEIERDILEELLTGDHKYYAQEVMAALRKSQKKHDRRVCPVAVVIEFDCDSEKECGAGVTPCDEAVAEKSTASAEAEESADSSDKAE